MKRLISIFLTVIMVVSVMPTISANSNTIFLEGTVSVFGNEVAGESSLLSDGFRLTFKEWRNIAATADYETTRPHMKTSEFVRFISSDSGIEWRFDEEKTVSAVDLWAWPCYAIDDYEVQIYKNNAWETVKSGTLNPDDRSMRDGVSDSVSNNTYWYSVVLDEAVQTNKLRFVIKTFTDSTYGAYIAEADLRASNDINLIANNSEANDGQSFSIYPKLYSVSDSTGNITSPGNPAPWRGWPSSNSGGDFYRVKADSEGNLWYALNFEKSLHAINKLKLNVASGTVKEFEVWCSGGWENVATNSGWTKVATVRGNITSSAYVEIPAAPASEGWKIKVTDSEGAVQLSVAEFYELPENELSQFARSIYEVYDDVCDGDVVTDSLNLADTVSTTAGNLSVIWSCDSENVNLETGAVTRLEEDYTITLAAKVADQNNSGAYLIIEKVYTVRGSGAPNALDLAEITEGLEIVDGTQIPVAGTNGSTVTVTSDNPVISVTREDDNWVISIGEATEETLVKVIVTTTYGDKSSFKEFEVTLSNPDDNVDDDVDDDPNVIFLDGDVSVFGNEVAGESSLLSDGFRLTFKEWRNIAATADYETTRPHKKTSEFVRFISSDSGIEWRFDEEKTVSAVDLWAWPCYAIDDYEVQIYKNDAWETVKRGTLNPDDRSMRDGVSDEGSNNTYWYSVVLDEAVKTNKLRFVIKSFTDDTYGAYIAESDLRASNNINLIANNSEANDGQSFSIYPKLYSASGSTGSITSPGSSAPWRGWPSSNDGKTIYNVKADGEGNLWYALNFEDSLHAINKLKINVASGMVKEFEVWSSKNWNTNNVATDEGWTKVATVSGNITSSAYVEIPAAPASEGCKIKVTDSEGDVQLSVAEFYELPEEELSPFAKGMYEVFDGVCNEIVVTDHLNLPDTVSTSAGDLAVDWSCDSPCVDVETGVVTRLDEDFLITLAAKVEIPGSSGVYRILEKDYWVRGNDTRPRAQLVNEIFTGSTAEIFSETTGTVTVSEGVATINGNSSANYDMSFDENFTFNGNTAVTIDFDDSTTSGSIDFVRTATKLLGLRIADGNIYVDYKGATYEDEMADGVKIEFIDGAFNLLLDHGEGYKICLYNEPLMSTGTFNKLCIATGDGEKIALRGVASDAVSADLISQIESQFNFSKISSYGSANLVGDLNLIDTLSDITFSYTSSDNDAVNAQTGEVDYSSAQRVTFTVTATSAGGSFTKSYTIITRGMENVFKGGAMSATGGIRSGYPIANAIDDDIDTMFITDSATGWKATVTLPECRYFNKLLIYKADTEGEVTGYTVEVSADGINYLAVYTGTTFTGEEIDIGTQYARFVKIIVNSLSQAGTGITEISAYLNQTDEERVTLDLADITDGLEIEDGAEIPAVGKFGSAVSVTADNELISAVQEDDKWVIKIGKATKETHVKATVTTQYGDESSSKEYKVILMADAEDIRNNRPQGSGGSGGGGAKGSVTTSGGTAAVIPGMTITNHESIYDVYRKELDGHWGKNEIQSMIDSGIITGDGVSLHLNNTVTRAEVLKMIVKAFGYEPIKYSGGYRDVKPEDWFSDYAEVAQKYGIMSGDGDVFRGNQPISRQEMAVVLVNVLRKQEIALSTDSSRDFADIADVASWALESVNVASSFGLIKGYETGDFLPINSLKRDESMVVVYRAIEFVKNQSVEVAE